MDRADYQFTSTPKKTEQDLNRSERKKRSQHPFAPFGRCGVNAAAPRARSASDDFLSTMMKRLAIYSAHRRPWPSSSTRASNGSTAGSNIEDPRLRPAPGRARGPRRTNHMRPS